MREDKEQLQSWSPSALSTRDSVLLEMPVVFATLVRVIRRYARIRLRRGPTPSSVAAMVAAEASSTGLI
jgi:hypothetical protein